MIRFCLIAIAAAFLISSIARASVAAEVQVTQTFAKKRTMPKAEAVRILSKWFDAVLPSPNKLNDGSPIRDIVNSVDQRGYLRSRLKQIVDSQWTAPPTTTTVFHYQTASEHRIEFAKVYRLEIRAAENVASPQGLKFLVVLYDNGGKTVDYFWDTNKDQIPLQEVLSALLVLCPNVK